MEVSREGRIARNEAVLRDVNENIRAAIGQQGNDGHVFEFLCECADPRCKEWVELTVAEYEEIRADGTRFVLGVGHGSEADAGDEGGDDRSVAENKGNAGAVTETHGPRAA